MYRGNRNTDQVKRNNRRQQDCGYGETGDNNDDAHCRTLQFPAQPCGFPWDKITDHIKREEGVNLLAKGRVGWNWIPAEVQCSQIRQATKGENLHHFPDTQCHEPHAAQKPKVEWQHPKKRAKTSSSMEISLWDRFNSSRLTQHSSPVVTVSLLWERSSTSRLSHWWMKWSWTADSPHCMHKIG